MSPDAKPCGLLLAGTNPVAVDCVCAALMGFHWQKLKMLVGALKVSRKPVADFEHDAIQVLSNEAQWQKPLKEFCAEDGFSFKPHFGWKGAIEK